MKTPETNETILKRLLTTEVKYLIAVVVFVFGVVAPYFDIKQDIELIKQNHFAHMEAIQKDIGEMKEDQLRLDKRQVELLELILKRQ